MNTIDDIVDFIESWQESNGILENEEQITEFIGKLQEQIAEMDFSVPDGTTIILYTGQSNKSNVWEIVENTSELLGDSASYISNLPAGDLLRNKAFKDALMDLVDQDENTFNKITSGNDNGVRLEGGSSGYGDYLSLDDFVSKRIVSGSTNASNNLIIFCPEEVDMTKVLPITELPAALNNSTYEYINGIPKSMFVDLYESGNTDAIYQLLSRLSEEVVGDTKGIPEQASLLQRAIGEGGILSRTSEELGLTLYFDELTGQLTAQLFSNSKGIPLLSDYAAGNCLLGETEIGTRYTKLAKGGRVFEIASDGQRVYLGRADIVTAEEATANGYKAVKGLNGILAKVTPEGTIKFLCVAGEAIGAVLIIKDAEEKFSDAWDKYRQGNYREGSKELISYGTALTASLVGSSLVASFAVAVGLAAGGPITIVASIVGCIIGYAIGQDIGDAIGDWVCDLLGYEDANYSNAGIAVRYDPLVIDLDGDGFELLSVKDGVYFDEDASGLIEKTAWVSAHDALLAIDLNGDGIINDGSELFGTSTKLANGSNARSGFEALAQYDLNGDGVINENDEVFGQLKVWQVKNGDGISQEDELYSLNDLGIESISLETSEEDGRLVAKANYKDGSELKIGEFDFDSQLYNTREKGDIDISEEIMGLPDIQAIGRVASLHTLMQLDETGILKKYVEQFANSLSREEREDLLTKILYFITGADQVAAGSRGSYIDARKLAVIEQFMGRDFVGTGGANPVNTAASILDNIYTDIYNAYYSMLMTQTHLANYMG